MIMSYLGKKTYANNPVGNKWDTYFVGFILFYTVICAIRWNVGTDSISYAYLFTTPEDRNDINGEFLFSCFRNISANLHLHYAIGLGICAFVQIFFLAKALNEYKFILITLPIVLFGSRYFLDLNNGIRQMIVASIFVYASRYIVERKLLSYVFLIILASMIHHSALILLPFYLLPKNFCIADKRILMLIIFLMCFFAGLMPSYQNIIGYATALSDIIGYDDYTERIGILLSEGRTEEALNFGPMMLSYLLSSIFTIWFGPQLKNRYENTIPYFNIWYILNYIFACAYFLVCNISHIFIRPIQYFELFQLIILSLLLYDFGYGKFKKQILYVILVVILWINISWDVTKASMSANQWESTTYKTFFMHQDQIDAIGITK